MARCCRVDAILGVHREECVHIGCTDADALRRALVGRAELIAGSNPDDAGNALHPVDDCDRNREAQIQLAAHVQSIGVGGGNRVIDSTGQALQHTEQRERNDDLREDEDGAAEFPCRSPAQISGMNFISLPR